ncbi:glycosyl transferase [Aureococcus anophagefferens]|nr:glycosyl transferase [Aureococcus anophagefferens]
MAAARRGVAALLLLAASRAGGAGGPIHVVVAASRNHYAGLLAVVASATNATGADAARLRFLLLVDGAGDAAAVGAAAACAAGDSARADAFAPRRLAAADGRGPRASATRSTTRAAARHSGPPARAPRPRARFFVGDLLPEARRAIYLDADVVVEASLAGLDGAAAAAFAANATAVVLAAAPRDFKRVCDHLVNCGAAAVRARFADPRARSTPAFSGAGLPEGGPGCALPAAAPAASLHVLHPGKTGGRSLASAVRCQPRIRKLAHHAPAGAAGPNATYAIVLREPRDRLASGLAFMVKGGEGIGDDAAAGATGFVENGPCHAFLRNRTVPAALGDAAGFRGACAAPAHAGPAGPGEPPSDAAFRRQSAWLPADAGADVRVLCFDALAADFDRVLRPFCEPRTGASPGGPAASPPRRNAAAPARALCPGAKPSAPTRRFARRRRRALRARLRQRDAGLLVAAREAARAARRALRRGAGAGPRAGGGGGGRPPRARRRPPLLSLLAASLWPRA